MVKQFRKWVVLIASMAVGTVFLAVPGSAFAFGQCGPGTTNPTSWVSQIQAMGVMSQTQSLEAAAGFHRMDGSFVSWVKERVIAAPLAQAANPEDFGCHPGFMFSVGHRVLPKGIVVLVALPKQFAKADVSVTRCNGCQAVRVTVMIVAKTNCANPERGSVVIIIFVHVHKKPVHKKRKPRPKPKPKPVPTCSANQQLVNGSCVTQQQQVTQNCGQGTVWNGQECVAVQSNCSNVNTGNGSPNQGGNCNNSCVGANVCNQQPPPEQCPPGTVGTPPNCAPPFTCPSGTVQVSPGKCVIPPLFISATRIQEVFVNKQGILLCSTLQGDDINKVTFTATTGFFLDGGQAQFDSSIGQWCDSTYASPSEPPSAVTPHPLPNQGPYPNNNAPDTYDVITMTASTSDGLSTSANNYVLIRPQPNPPGSTFLVMSKLL